MQNQFQDRSTSTLAALIGAIVLAMTFLGARALGGQAADRGAFVLRAGKDTLVVERFTRTADTLAGTLSMKGLPRTDYVIALGPGNAVRTLSLSSFRLNAPADEGPTRRIFVTMRGDSAIVELDGATQRIATKSGAIPGFNNSFALFELFTRRVRAAGASLDIPYFALSNGASIPVSLKPAGPDSIVVSLVGQEQRLRVDAEGRILGGSVPAQKLDIIRIGEAEAAGVTVGRTDYSAPPGAPYSAEEVTLKGQGGIPLGGTLTLPKSAGGRVPAIVTITGSGQQDRDEFIPVAGGYRPFRQVADTLGRRGIAVLRLDDRMIGSSGGRIGTSADYAEDIRAALAYLRTRPEIDGARLGLVGHSEGGLIAPLVAASEPALKGIVLLAGPAYNGLDILRFQQKNAVDRDTAIAPAKRDSAYRAYARLTDSVAAKEVWMKFFVTHDPLATARKVKVPALILQGRTDQQVTFEQAGKLGAAMRGGGNRDVTVRVFPEMNHLFIHDPDGNPAGYARLATNRMDAAVLGAIADWLAERLAVTTKR
jgi:hypothetical protein